MDVKLQNFVASNFWVGSFKRKRNIVSRNITKLVTTNLDASITTVGPRYNELAYYELPVITNHFEIPGKSPMQIMQNSSVIMNSDIMNSPVL